MNKEDLLELKIGDCVQVIKGKEEGNIFEVIDISIIKHRKYMATNRADYFYGDVLCKKIDGKLIEPKDNIKLFNKRKIDDQTIWMTHKSIKKISSFPIYKELKLF